MSNMWDIRWKDYYQILQVHPTARQEVIKAAYERLARTHHPDVNQEPSAAKRMVDINEAFEVLGNLNNRRLYHPEWLRKRRESNNRQAPPRTSIHHETYEHPETPVRPTDSKSRIPAWGKWVIGLTIIFFGVLLIIIFNSVLSSTPDIPTTTPSPAPVRLPTGTYLVKNLTGGWGELEIDNGLDLDAVAVLSRPEEPKVSLTAVYIRATDSHTIRGIIDGVYILYFKIGEDWDDGSKKFMGKEVYQRFEEEFDFETLPDQYTIWEITLNPVVGGTADTESLSEDEFPVID